MAPKGHGWRIRAFAAMAILLALATTATARAADRSCVKRCGAQSANCKRFFGGTFKAVMAECRSNGGAARRHCITTATRQKRSAMAQCTAALKRDCKPCCAGSDPDACGLRVCGDGQQVAGEGCEPPGSASCDAQCQLIVITTSTAPPSTSTTTTSTSTTTTTTTTMYAGVGVGIEISPPPNGTHFVAGDQPVVRVLLADDAGRPLALAELGTANLYMYGPQDESVSTTSLALLRAAGNRNARPHHYVDLKTSPDVVVSGNVLSYPLSAVTDELPGTYTVAAWVTLAADPLHQWMPLADCQIRTPVVETPIVGPDRCASCHLGAASGKFYMHHVDPGFSPAGNWALDSAPVRGCKACHNQDGYAGYNNGAGGSDANVNRTTDPIVRRVHGVHRGAELALPFDNDPVAGDFKDYTHVEFPADLRNCTTCHVDDRWKTEPSRQACTTCHDAVWFGAAAATPAGYENHAGGEQPDGTCSACHKETSLYPISVSHEIPPPPLDDVVITMTTPANGSYYVGGEAPLVTIVLKDDAGAPIDHALVTDKNFATAGLFVYGNRAYTIPVLTNTARYGAGKLRASVSNAVAATGSPAGWTFGAADTFRVAVNGGVPLDLAAPAGFQTPTQVKNWLAGALTGVTVTSSSTGVTIKSNLQGESSRIDVYDSPVTTIMGWKAAGVITEPDTNVGRSSYPINDLRALSDPLDYADPAVTRSTANVTYQLDDVAGLPPGTYGAYVWSRPTAGKVPGLSKVGYGFVTFQVGTATPEKKIATNCTNCHGDTIMHVPTPTERGPHPARFDTDQCKACHDYSHPNTGDAFKNQGGTSLNGWSGFGAVPISRRVHGVHFGRYLVHSNEIYSGADPFAELVFPQDIRNCTTCHAETNDWNEQPSRLACLACHDSDTAKAHGTAMTVIPDPTDPYGPTAVETCSICHGADAPWSAAIVHDVWDPYAPPYPRDPEH